MSDEKKPVRFAPGALYGYCPRCGSPGEYRDHKKWKDRCQEDHVYDSMAATEKPVAKPKTPGIIRRGK